MFTTEYRDGLAELLRERARSDPRVVGAALVGSAATGRQDRWSDIDLALQIADGVDPDGVAEEWTAWMRAEQDVADTLDVRGAGTLFRVFLLANSLQVDLSFWRHDDFRATEPGFRVLFGTPNPATEPNLPDPAGLIAMAWLHALHSRSAVARGRLWQATIMLDGLRERLVSLACLRHGLNPHQGRGVDQLPTAELDALTATRPSAVEQQELRRAHNAALAALAAEATRHDRAHAERLAPALRALAG
ncbi:nucleotidyltransferase domain-containing protein [Occultella glacieicola]|uniref:Nucleotidyltransferase domain-containing protein n=1 Tax=Occultella glacieicola TaxID=2518684 RepID=A0ABY2E2R0_9MICO|nr:nucleotidyltransferase domain-containing protein [Occultella glacieicola]TDE93909.1 nucleotidyltransferase domain-containing protein [Occultella glacieicola]